MRVVDAEHPHALLRPEDEDRQQLLPQLAPAVCLEIERVDVLVLLRRVLGVLDRAVRAVLEPFGVLARVRVVGRALEGDVERDIDLLLRSGLDQVLKVRERAEPFVDRLVAAFLRPDGPRAAWLAWLGRPVVRALAVRAADGVDGRQVEDVEAHAGDVWQQTFDVFECSLPAGLWRCAVRAPAACRAWEQLVPGAEPRLHRLDQHLELAAVWRHVPLRVAAHELDGLRVHVGLTFAKRLREGSQARGVLRGAVGAKCALRAPGALRGCLDQTRPDLQLDLHVLARLEPLDKLPAPAREVVDPALDGVDVAAQLRDWELRPPAIVDQR